MSETTLKFRVKAADLVQAIERHTEIRNPVIEDDLDADGLVNGLIHIAGHGDYLEADCALTDDCVLIKIRPQHSGFNDSVIPMGTDVLKLIVSRERSPVKRKKKR